MVNSYDKQQFDDAGVPNDHYYSYRYNYYYKQVRVVFERHLNTNITTINAKS